MSSAPRPSLSIARRLALVGALVVAASYVSLGSAFYASFSVSSPENVMRYVGPLELSGLFLYCAVGGVVLALLALALEPGPDWVGRLASTSGRGARLVIASLGGLVFLGGLVVSQGVLRGAPVADDEHTYRFIARTFRETGLVAPSPGSDLPFFREPFVVLNEHVRYGKYPPGHPLLLALGQSLGLEVLVVPLLAALAVVPLAGLAWRLFDERTAVLAVLFYSLSPQILLTGGTALSQPTSLLATLLGYWAIVAAPDAGGQQRAWMLGLAGGALGFGILARPLPGVFFAATALVEVACRATPVRRLRESTALAWPIGLAAGALLVVNQLQTGSTLLSGYDLAHPPAGGGSRLFFLFEAGLADRASSVVGSLLRLSVWLAGFPLAWLLGLLAGGSRATKRLLLLALLPALAYRLAVPKVGIASTGSIYWHETIPFVCLAMAAGTRRLLDREAGAWSQLLPPRRVSALLLAGFSISAALFVPYRIIDLRRMSDAQLAVTSLLAERQPGRCVVFYDWIVPPWTGRSWAYGPRPNGPRLDDEVLYLRLHAPAGTDALEEAIALWQRRFPDRAAFLFTWIQGRQPLLLPLLEARGRVSISAAGLAWP